MVNTPKVKRTVAMLRRVPIGRTSQTRLERGDRTATTLAGLVSQSEPEVEA